MSVRQEPALRDSKYLAEAIVCVFSLCSGSLAWALSPGQLNDVVERQNRGLPVMVAKELRQEKVQVVGSTIVYRYTHLRLDAAQLRNMRLETTQRPYIYPRICQEADTGRILREGVSIRYVYLGSDGGVGGGFQISPSDCR